MTTNDSEPRDALEIAVRVAMELYLVRALRNLERVRGLVELHLKVGETGLTVEHGTQVDILRAAVVFMHAALEEFLRQLALTFLPHADEAVLNTIPLVGFNGRPEKFFLGKLAHHREKSVSSLIEESVREHLSTSNYNDVRDIAHLLQAAKIKTDEDLGSTYAAISEMMQRRHQIVHRADNVEKDGVVGQKPLTGVQVLEWVQAVVHFFGTISMPATTEHLVKNGPLRREPDGTYTLAE